jgi:hypothetical protein
VSTSTAVATAVAFVWLGMVLAISFLEAPLKFQAPGVTLPVGLGIGRLVFRVLNLVEGLFAVVLVIASVAHRPAPGVIVAAASAVGVLLVQLTLVRPQLSRRSDVVLAGVPAPHSIAHHWYIGLEVLKVAALLATGSLLLAQ